MSDIFTVTIKLGNSAFGDGNLESEVARILRALADHIEGHSLPSAKALRDVNGNRVGTAETSDV